MRSKVVSVMQSQFPRMHHDPVEGWAEWTVGTGKVGKVPWLIGCSYWWPIHSLIILLFFPPPGSGEKSPLSTSPKQTNRRHWQRVAHIRLKINIEHTPFVHVATAQGQPSSKLLHRVLSSSISQHQHQSRSSCSSRQWVQYNDANLVLSLWANRSSTQTMVAEQGHDAAGNPGKIRMKWVLRFRWRISSILAFKNQHDYFSAACQSTQINSH